MCGSPVAHSLSPALHQAAYRELGLDWLYEARECDAGELPGLFTEARTDPLWAGFSLTMPLKTPALPLLDDVEELGVAVGAVNTVVPQPQPQPQPRPQPQGSRRGVRLYGFNTDVGGMVAALAERGVHEVGRAVVLGAGGTAMAALAALAQLGERRPIVAARDPARAGPLLAAARRLDVLPEVVGYPARDAVLRADLVLSTVPARATDRLAHEIAAAGAGAPPGRPMPGVSGGWPRHLCLFDVVYSPWPTLLAQVAAEAGAPVVGGLDLLVHQAVRQVELMTGRTVDASVLRAAGFQASRGG